VLDTGPRSPGVTTWDGTSARSLAQALAVPADDCIEAGLPGPRRRPPRRKPSGGRLGLRVTALSVYNHPVAKLFAAALRTRLDLPADLHERLRTALQEAMMNAMLHGNLGLASRLQDSLQTLAASHSVIKARFAIGRIAGSMIRVEATWSSTTLRVVVRDSGDGYNKSELPSLDDSAAVSELGSGRGLVILENLCDHVGLHRGGTTIDMDFRLPEGQNHPSTPIL
jgi:anti-sigma regulatory factor (Ser/Thr protein kinase)